MQKQQQKQLDPTRYYPPSTDSNRNVEEVSGWKRHYHFEDQFMVLNISKTEIFTFAYGT
jgi:hypothetical protein